MNMRYDNIPISNQLDKNLELIKDVLSNNQSIVYRQFESSAEDSVRFCLVFSKNLSDSDKILETILKPVMSGKISTEIQAERRIEFILGKVLLTCESKELETIDKCIKSILSGNAALLIDGCKAAISVDASNRRERSVEEPESNKVMRGPREGFNEFIETNVALIQQRIQSADLKLKYLNLGRETNTQICIAYMENIASPKILSELEKRLGEIDLDGIIDSHYIESYIRDEPLSVFRTTGYADRPDIVCAKLLEGRIAIVCNGSPDVITIPYLFLENFQSNDDYYKEFAVASFYRILRYISFIITTCAPAIYLSLVNYHQELIPSDLLISIMAARNSVPFPTVIELLLMLLVFEILIEASRRLPANVGPTVSIVGGLILGEAAVSARLISAPIIIMTAISGTTSFLLPLSGGPVIFIRILCLAFSSVLGLYGFVFSTVVITVYTLSIRSFGVPYTLGLTTFSRYDIQDTIVVVPWWYVKYRPRIIAARNFVRQRNRKREKIKE